MSVNAKPTRFSNQQQIRVKSFKTYNLMLMDRYPATFNLILDDGKRSGFYVRTACNFYKVGSLQLQSNVVPLSSEGLSPEEEAQILVKWNDITDRPIVKPSQIDDAILNPNVLDTGYTKVIVRESGTKENPVVLKSKTWYIASVNIPDDFTFKLPSNPNDLDTVKVSVQYYKVANVYPGDNNTVDRGLKPIVISNDSREFVFDANTGDWIVLK